MKRVICLFCNGLMLCNPASCADMGPYMAQMRRSVMGNWDPPEVESDSQTLVSYTIHSDGTIENIRLVRCSGFGALDKAALDAVEAASPLAELPSCAPEAVNVQFTFDYRAEESVNQRHAS